MPKLIRNLYRGHYYTFPVFPDPGICPDEDLYQLQVNVGTELSSEDAALMHTYNWYSVKDRKSWRINLD